MVPESCPWMAEGTGSLTGMKQGRIGGDDAALFELQGNGDQVKCMIGVDIFVVTIFLVIELLWKFCLTIGVLGIYCI